MKPKAMIRIVVDCAMTVLLMLLMASELLGRFAHEWIGTAMFILFILYHILNRRWTKSLLRGRYTPYRMLQTVSAALVLFTMCCSLVGALIMSRHVFAFLPIHGGRSFGRVAHLIGAYWGFVLMAFHLGIHWNGMLAVGRRMVKPSQTRSRILRILAAVMALYGVYAFFARSIPQYMFLRTRFVFFDYEEPIIFFFFDYLAVMISFAWLGFYAARAAQRGTKIKMREKEAAKMQERKAAKMQK